VQAEREWAAQCHGVDTILPAQFPYSARDGLTGRVGGTALGYDLSYGPPWAHYLGGCQDRLLDGPLGLLGLCHTTPNGVGRKDYGGEVLG
jgi:hypothetical protein